MWRPPMPPPGCRSLSELEDLDCSEVSEAEMDYFLTCQTIMRLEMESDSDSQDY